MTNEEHVEEMFYLAHYSGVFTKFSNEVNLCKENSLRRCSYEVIEDVFNRFVSQGLIISESELYNV